MYRSWYFEVWSVEQKTQGSSMLEVQEVGNLGKTRVSKTVTTQNLGIETLDFNG
jgi:hypothetical protein